MTKGARVKNLGKFRDVIYGRPQDGYHPLENLINDMCIFSHHVCNKQDFNFSEKKIDATKKKPWGIFN